MVGLVEGLDELHALFVVVLYRNRLGNAAALAEDYRARQLAVRMSNYPLLSPISYLLLPVPLLSYLFTNQ